MRKMIIFSIMLFCLFCNVKALSFYEMEVGDIYKGGTEVEVSYHNSWALASNVAYYDKNNELLEAFAIELNSDRDEMVNYKIGDSCFDTDSLCNYSEDVIVSNDDYYKNIKYWEVIAINNPNLLEFCEVKNVSKDENKPFYETKYPDSELCNSLFENTDAGGVLNDNSYVLSFPFIIFKEVGESKYGLECKNNFLRKGSNVDCTLSVNSFHEVTDIVVSFDSSNYSFEKALGTKDWTLKSDKNEGNIVTYTLNNEKGIKGKSDVLNFTIKLKKDLLPGHVVGTKEILYTLKNGVEFNSTAKGSLADVKEAVDPSLEEDENSDTTDDNPETSDSVVLLILLAVSFCGISYIFIKKKKLLQ